jgi:hypothetical protein
MINYINNLRYDEKRGFIFDMEKGDSFVMKYLPLKKCYGLKHGKRNLRGPQTVHSTNLNGVLSTLCLA